MVGERSKPISPPKHKAGLGRIAPAGTDSEVIGSGTPRATSRNLKLTTGNTTTITTTVRFHTSFGVGVSEQYLVLT